MVTAIYDKIFSFMNINLNNKVFWIAFITILVIYFVLILKTFLKNNRDIQQKAKQQRKIELKKIKKQKKELQKFRKIIEGL
ncbi:MAG: hypothetical protein QT05_C0012G0005 [archaeon GW2011_AR13]|nr:MAG: hypothetical protein QT05_C0012G0005 [archaeon GW2011_AR13]HIG94039.1 hypothetical protein [Nanoarchaeota archaeon]HIH63769.1 hypothetical protein [Nanoarchaeota archaeon]HIJ09642.1 hypothetical protein [Nanoarchaeota archaeon]